MEFIGYSTKYKKRGPFTMRNLDLVLTDFANHLETRIGSRVMMPEWGSSIPDLVMEPLDDELAEEMRDEIRRVADEEPRITVSNINIIDDNRGGVNIGIQVRYDGRDTNLTLNFNNG